VVSGKWLTLGETGTQETGNLLDKSIGSDEGIVLACELLDQLLVLVELLQVISRHGVNTTVLGTIDIVLVTENATIVSAQVLPSFVRRNIFALGSNIPDGHVWAGNLGELDGSRETLITLGIVVLEANLQLDGLEEVALLGLQGVLKELLDVGSHSGCEGKKSASPSLSLLLSPSRALRIDLGTYRLRSLRP
jgi:hypothetical protein